MGSRGTSRVASRGGSARLAFLASLLLSCSACAGQGRAASEASLVVPDKLAFPDEEIYVEAHLYRTGILGFTRSGISGEVLRFFGPQGNPLRSLLTDASGTARILYRTPKPGRYSFSVRLTENPRHKAVPATGTVFVEPKRFPLFFVTVEDALMRPRRIPFLSQNLSETEPRVHAVPSLTKIASCHAVIYLTHRSLLSLRTLRSWLADKSYPPGPLYCLDASSLQGILSEEPEKVMKKIESLWRNRSIRSRLATCDPNLATTAARKGIQVFLLPARNESGPSTSGHEEVEEEHLERVRDWKGIVEECACKSRSSREGSQHPK